MIKEKIFSYKDKQKLFMLKCLNKVDFFRNLSEDSQCHIIYKMAGKEYFEGENLVERGHDATSLFFLQKGQISVNTICEHTPFCLEKLYKGSIINFRTFF